MAVGAKADSVITVDCHYIMPEHAAAYLIVEGDRAAFVDNNTAHAVPLLIDALASHGLGPEHVAYAIITHLHLDHAGGTSALASRCPNATVIAHPRAVRHLVDPARLIASAKRVYGEERFNALYGAIAPIEEGRIRTVQDAEALQFGRRTLRFLHTPGHAKHHICIHDSASNGVFTGDAFGVAFNARRRTTKPFLLCSTPPTDFDPQQARASIKKILATGAGRIYFAHFGTMTSVHEGGQAILESIGHMEALLEEAAASALNGSDLARFCAVRLHRVVEDQARASGAVFGKEEWHCIETDVQINAQGLALAAERRRRDG